MLPGRAFAAGALLVKHILVELMVSCLAGLLPGSKNLSATFVEV